MTDKDTNKSADGLEEQFREMLRKANISFIMNQPQPTPEGAPGREPEEPDHREDRLNAIREFSLKPHDIRDYLDRFVIRQDEAKKVLAVAICDHYNHVRRCIKSPETREKEYSKHNIILLGPTGVGKTYLLRCIAKLIGVPFVKADATKFTETGYVGHDVEDLVRDLVKVADGDTELAQYGIIYLDEIDKIAAQQTVGGKDVSGRGVQINLLKLMEETEASLFSQTDLIGQMQAVIDMQRGKDTGKRVINTRHILFIVSGSFNKLADQVRQRLRKSRIGFSDQGDGEQTDGDHLRLAQTKDFIDYGFEPEFIGRLPVRVVCDALTAEDLEEIMTSSEDNILSQYLSDFEGYGIALHLEPTALRLIAEQAFEEKTGARGLMTVLERLFRNYKFELPSTAIKSFKIDHTAVKDSEAALGELLKSRESVQRDVLRDEVQAFAREFEQAHGLKLVFAKEAAESVVEMCVRKSKSVRSLCAERFRDFEYGLKLVARNTGRTTFNVTRKLVDNPSEELSRRIAASFRKNS